MRLLIGWMIRGVFISALAAFIVTLVIVDPNTWDWRTYWICVAALSGLSALYFVADYLIDYDDWQREAGKR